MKTKILIIFLLMLITVPAFADYNKLMGADIYSIYLERQNHIHEADSGRIEYNPELDKSLGIEIGVLCKARGRTSKQCWNQMLWEIGAEFTPYKGF